MAIWQVLPRLLARLGVGRKLALIYLLDLTAVTFISGILINEKFIAIDFARKEVAGNAYIRALRPSLVSLGSVRLAPEVRPAPAQQTVQAAEAAHGANMDSPATSETYRAALAALQDASGASLLAQRQAEAIDRGRQLGRRVRRLGASPRTQRRADRLTTSPHAGKAPCRPG